MKTKCCAWCKKPLTRRQRLPSVKCRCCSRSCSMSWRMKFHPLPRKPPKPVPLVLCEMKCGKALSKRQIQCRNRFCGWSCAATWRQRYTDTKNNWKKMHTPEAFARNQATRLAPNSRWRRDNRKYMTERNPMFNADAKRRQTETLRAMGHKPSVQGGNGRGLTVPQAILLKQLGRPWVSEHILRTGNGYLPHHYKLDLALPSKKIAIEVDGATHQSLKVQATDARKDKFLRGIGWFVCRVSNASVLTGKAFEYITSRLKRRSRRTSSRRA